MVEHTAVNRGVVGSSPTRGASEEKKSGREQPAFQSIERIAIEMCRKLTKSHRLMLFFDDVQWMDTMSFQLLNRLLLTLGTEKILFICRNNYSYS